MYRVPHDLVEVRLWSWGPSKSQHYRLSVSADGETFEPLAATQEKTTYAANRGGRKATEVRFRALPRPGFSYLKVEWADTAELERVELYCGHGVAQ